MGNNIEFKKSGKKHIQNSGIRKLFDLAEEYDDVINLCIDKYSAEFIPCNARKGR